MVSTSGSSGTAARLSRGAAAGASDRGRRPRSASPSSAQVLPRLRAAACSACFLDRPSPSPAARPRDVHDGVELLGVVGPSSLHDVDGQLVEARGRTAPGAGS